MIEQKQLKREANNPPVVMNLCASRVVKKAISNETKLLEDYLPEILVPFSAIYLAI